MVKKKRDDFALQSQKTVRADIQWAPHQDTSLTATKTLWTTHMRKERHGGVRSGAQGLHWASSRTAAPSCIPPAPLALCWDLPRAPIELHSSSCSPREQLTEVNHPPRSPLASREKPDSLKWGMSSASANTVISHANCWRDRWNTAPHCVPCVAFFRSMDERLSIYSRARYISSLLWTACLYILPIKKKTWLKKNTQIGTSLAVQWLRLLASNAEDQGSSPGQGTKIPCAPWHGPKQNKQKETNRDNLQ